MQFRKKMTKQDAQFEKLKQRALQTTVDDIEELNIPHFSVAVYRFFCHAEETQLHKTGLLTKKGQDTPLAESPEEVLAILVRWKNAWFAIREASYTKNYPQNLVGKLVDFLEAIQIIGAYYRENKPSLANPFAMDAVERKDDYYRMLAFYGNTDAGSIDNPQSFAFGMMGERGERLQSILKVGESHEDFGSELFHDLLIEYTGLYTQYNEYRIQHTTDNNNSPARDDALFIKTILHEDTGTQAYKPRF